jgi:putative transposase
MLRYRAMYGFIPFVQAMVAATVRTISRQPNRRGAQAQLARVVEMLRERFPHAVAPLVEAEEDVLTCDAFPAEHRRQIASTDPLERLNTGLKRRSAVVDISPNRTAVLCLLGGILAEQNDEWLVGRRYFRGGSMRNVLRPAEEVRLALEAPAA